MAKPIVPACKNVRYGDLIPTVVDVARFSLRQTGATVSYTLRRGWQSRMEIGVKGENGWVGLGMSSAVEFTGDREVAFAPRSGKYGYRLATSINYRKWKRVCDNKEGPDRVTRRWVQPESWGGGTYNSYGTAPDPALSKCEPYEAGSKWTDNNTRASTYSTAAKLPAVTLSAQTGYNAGSSLSVSFQKSRRLCGTLGKPTGSTRFGQLVIR